MKTSDAEGVHVPVVPWVVGALALVTVMPPAEYPVPVTSPVAVYVVVAAEMVADVRYNAALTVSVVGAVKLVRLTRVMAPS